MHSVRIECIFCSSNSLKVLLEKDYSIPLRTYTSDILNKNYHTMPYNIQLCNICKTVQTKYIGELSIIYENNPVSAYGTIRNKLNVEFAEIIHNNKNINSIVEIGAGNGELSEILLEKKNYSYTIIDPSYCGPTNNRTILPSYFENLDLNTIPCDTIVMSHVFEHFYNPIDILNKLRNIPSLKFVHLALPDLDSFIEDGTYHVLNPEHTFYVTNQFIIDIFNYYGFKLNTIRTHHRHSIFIEFEKVSKPLSIPFPVNNNTEEKVMIFFNRLLENIKIINSNMSGLPTYIWPCSMHTIFSLSLGLNKNCITAVLDNSPTKIGSYLYDFEILTKAFSSIIKSDEKKIVILVGGCYNTEVIEEVKQNKNNLIFFI